MPSSSAAMQCFQKSCSEFGNYPCNLILTDQFEYDLEQFKAMLDAGGGGCFASRKPANICFWSLSDTSTSGSLFFKMPFQLADHVYQASRPRTKLTTRTCQSFCPARDQTQSPNLCKPTSASFSKYHLSHTLSYLFSASSTPGRQGLH